MVGSPLIKFQKKLVSRIKELREEHNIAQLELAKLVGVSRQYIYYLERGDYNPSTTISLKIAEIFKKKVEEIFYFEPVIKDLMGSKTLDELDKIAEFTGINIERITNLRKINDKELSEMYSQEELTKITDALGLEFQNLFENEV